MQSFLFPEDLDVRPSRPLTTREPTARPKRASRAVAPGSTVSPTTQSPARASRTVARKPLPGPTSPPRTTRPVRSESLLASPPPSQTRPSRSESLLASPPSAPPPRETRPSRSESLLVSPPQQTRPSRSESLLASPPPPKRPSRPASPPAPALPREPVTIPSEALPTTTSPPRASGARRPRPMPIILPPTYVYNAVDYSNKPLPNPMKDEVLVSVARLDVPQRSPGEMRQGSRSPTRMSMPERSPTFQKFVSKDFRDNTSTTNSNNNKKPSLTRWASATLGKQEKQDRNARMVLAEAERKAHAVARIDSAMTSPGYRRKGGLSAVGEDVDYGVHHAVF